MSNVVMCSCGLFSVDSFLHSYLLGLLYDFLLQQFPPLFSILILCCGLCYLLLIHCLSFCFLLPTPLPLWLFSRACTSFSTILARLVVMVCPWSSVGGGEGCSYKEKHRRPSKADTEGKKQQWKIPGTRNRCFTPRLKGRERWGFPPPSLLIPFPYFSVLTSAFFSIEYTLRHFRPSNAPSFRKANSFSISVTFMVIPK